MILLLWLVLSLATLGNSTAQFETYFSHINPNNQQKIGITLTLPDGWHTYSKNPGPSGYPPSVTWDLPDGWHASDLDFPEPVAIQENQYTVYGYTTDVTLLTTLVPNQAYTAPAVDITATVSWLVCHTACEPVTQRISTRMPVANTPPVQHTTLPDTAPDTAASLDLAKLGLMIAFAFLGGLILNIMPCVLPIIAIKALSSLKQKTCRPIYYGLSYTAGILSVMLVLASIITVAQAAGQELGWGFQLQNPNFIMILLWLFFAMGLQLLGVLPEFPALPTGRLDKLPGPLNAWGSGVITTLVSTPCSAPFMGTALGFTLTQPTSITYLIFVVLGIGLASPILIISSVSRLITWLPKPGAWLHWVRPVLSIPLFLTVLWLFWILYYNSGLAFIGLSISGLVAIFLLTARYKAAILVILLGCLSVTGRLAINQTQPVDTTLWNAYTPEFVQALELGNHAYFINFTAKWCITCQVNQYTTLSNPEVLAWFSDNDITLIKADWTTQDALITQALAAVGRNSVPTYYLYYPNQAPKLLPEILTPQRIYDTI